MKIFVIFILSLGIASAKLGITLPENVYTMAELDTAAKKAAKNNTAIVFIYTDIASNVKNTNKYSLAAFDAFRKKSVPVFVNIREKYELNMLSPLAHTALREDRIGNIYPKVVATSPAMDRIWGQLSYEEIRQSQKITSLKKRILAIGRGQEKAPFNRNKILKWPTRDTPGFFWEGRFISFEGEILTLEKPDGNNRTLKLSQLSDTSAAFAHYMATTSTKAEPSKFKQEIWSNQKGKKISGSFVKLKGKQITLQLKNGKLTTFAIDQLSEESQARARKLAGE